MAEDDSLTALQAKVWVIYLRNTQRICLSRNVTREVCLYIDRDYLPCIFGNTLRLFDIETHYFKDTVLDFYPFDRSWVFCYIGSQAILGVSNSRSTEICISTQVVVEAGKLITSRGRPGLIWAGSWAYAFGGNVTHPLSSCEKYDTTFKTWKSISEQMKYPKSCFTPCWVEDEVYLCCLTEKNEPFEAFSPATETFRSFPVSYASKLFGSVTFLVRDTLYIVGAEDVLLKWKLSKSKLEPVKLAGLMGISDSASSNVTPMRVRRTVGWTCYSTKKPVLFDIDEEVLSWGI